MFRAELTHKDILDRFIYKGNIQSNNYEDYDIGLYRDNPKNLRFWARVRPNIKDNSYLIACRNKPRQYIRLLNWKKKFKKFKNLKSENDHDILRLKLEQLSDYVDYINEHVIEKENTDVRTKQTCEEFLRRIHNWQNFKNSQHNLMEITTQKLVQTENSLTTEMIHQQPQPISLKQELDKICQPYTNQTGHSKLRKYYPPMNVTGPGPFGTYFHSKPNVHKTESSNTSSMNHSAKKDLRKKTNCDQLNTMDLDKGYNIFREASKNYTSNNSLQQPDKQPPEFIENITNFDFAKESPQNILSAQNEHTAGIDMANFPYYLGPCGYDKNVSFDGKENTDTFSGTNVTRPRSEFISKRMSFVEKQKQNLTNGSTTILGTSQVYKQPNSDNVNHSFGENCNGRSDAGLQDTVSFSSANDKGNINEDVYTKVDKQIQLLLSNNRNSEIQNTQFDKQDNHQLLLSSFKKNRCINTRGFQIYKNRYSKTDKMSPSFSSMMAEKNNLTIQDEDREIERKNNFSEIEKNLDFFTRKSIPKNPKSAKNLKPKPVFFL